jgi:hypothetical protein
MTLAPGDYRADLMDGASVASRTRCLREGLLAHLEKLRRRASAVGGEPARRGNAAAPAAGVPEQRGRLRARPVVEVVEMYPGQKGGLRRVPNPNGINQHAKSQHVIFVVAILDVPLHGRV